MKSKFNGRLLGYIGISLLEFVIIVFSLGLATPWAICIAQRWSAKHTIIDGHQVVFDGTGWQLFGNMVKWFLLTVITIGIFGLWLPIKSMQWVVKHTHLLPDAPIPNQQPLYPQAPSQYPQQRPVQYAQAPAQYPQQRPVQYPQQRPVQYSQAPYQYPQQPEYKQDGNNNVARFLLTFFLGWIGSIIINHSDLKPQGYTSRTLAYFFLPSITFGIYGLVASICNLTFDSSKDKNIGYKKD